MSTITGTINNGITLTGSYASPLTITSTGAVYNNTIGFGNAVYGNTTGDTVVNQGQITKRGASADAVHLQASLGSVVNSGTITGGRAGVWLERGGNISVTSAGTIYGRYAYGVQTKQSTTVSNDGTIVGAGVAVGIGDGPGFVTNTNYIRLYPRQLRRPD